MATLAKVVALLQPRAPLSKRMNGADAWRVPCLLKGCAISAGWSILKLSKTSQEMRGSPYGI